MEMPNFFKNVLSVWFGIFCVVWLSSSPPVLAQPPCPGILIGVVKFIASQAIQNSTEVLTLLPVVLLLLFLVKPLRIINNCCVLLILYTLTIGAN